MLSSAELAIVCLQCLKSEWGAVATHLQWHLHLIVCDLAVQTAVSVSVSARVS